MDTLFHISLPCNDVKATKSFYKNNIGATIGRYNNNWVDINLYGHQITFTNAGKFNFNNPNYVFEGKILPSFHFGVILEEKIWEIILNKLKSQKLNLVTQTTFLKGKPGEHTSFFIKDPNDYMIEFKCFGNSKEIFSK